jgi:ubiquinone biosynthesis protein UbiJ
MNLPSPLNDLLLPAVRARCVLLANHVLHASPAATARLKPHAGRSLRIEVVGWRGPLPVPPPLSLRITPAGLLDVLPAALADAAVDLHVRLDGSKPLHTAGRLLAGDMPSVAIEGDAAFAGDVNWVLANVRWDLVADLDRVFGPVIAQGLGTVGARLSAAAQGVARGAAGLVRKGWPGTS